MIPMTSIQENKLKSAIEISFYLVVLMQKYDLGLNKLVHVVESLNDRGLRYRNSHNRISGYRDSRSSHRGSCHKGPLHRELTVLCLLMKQKKSKR